MARTVAQLLADLAYYWGKLSGPIIPPQSTFAQCQAITGFTALFEAFCAEYSVEAGELSALEAGMSFPEVTYE